MKTIIQRTTLLVVAVLMTVAASAQCFFDSNGNLIGVDGNNDCTNTIITAVPFLRITPDARSGAMGDVGLAISADANAMHVNASKLVFAERDLGFSITYTPWLRALQINDVYMAYLSGYRQLDKNQAVGLGLRYFSLGDIQFTNEQGEPVGQNRPNEVELALAYSRKLTDNLSAGLGLKYIYSNLANGQTVGGTEIEAGQAMAADISFTYMADLTDNSSLTAALALSNLGPKISYTNSINKDFLPSNLGIGAAYEVDIDEYNTFVFALDINKLMVPSPIPAKIKQDDGTLIDNPEYDGNGNGIPDFKEKSVVSGIFGSFGDAPGGGSEEIRELMYSIGAEYWYDEQFSVRAGYYSEHATKGNRKYFTVGMGLKYNVFGLNFSYLVPTTNQRNPLDNTLRFSLMFDFGAFEADDL